MKKKKQDTQKTSELLQKLQEAVLSSQKDDNDQDAPDSDEIAFQKKIAGMLSRVAPQSKEPEQKKQKKKARIKATPSPVSEPVIEEAPPVVEFSEDCKDEEPLAQSIDEAANTETNEIYPQPTKIERSKRTRAKKQVLRQKSEPKTDTVSETENLMEEVSNTPSENHAVCPSDPEVAAPAEEIAPIEIEASETEPDVSFENFEAEAPTEESNAFIPQREADPKPSAILQEEIPASPRRAETPRKKPSSIRVVTPKQSVSSNNKKDPDTIVISPKSELKSTVPIVIKPNQPQKAPEPIRVEVKKAMPKAPKTVSSPPSPPKPTAPAKKSVAEKTTVTYQKKTTLIKSTTAGGATKSVSSKVSAPRAPQKSASAAPKRTTSHRGSGTPIKNNVEDERYSVALENVLYDNLAEEAEPILSIKRDADQVASNASSPVALFSAQEILKYTEKKTGFTADDISMILELGYEHELGNLIGRDALKKLKADHARASRPVDKLRYLTAFGYRNQEYTGEQSPDFILANYVRDKKTLIFRLVMTALITLLLLPLELPFLFNGLFTSGQWNLPPILFPLLSLMGLIFATALSHKCVRAGIRSFLRISPTPYSATALICTVAILAGGVNLFLVRSGKEFVSLILPAAATLLLTAVCDATRLASEMRTFQILTALDEKTILEPAEPNKQKLRHGDKIVKIVNDDVGQNLYRVRKSNLVSGFFRRCNDYSSALRPFGFLLLASLTLSFLTGFVSAVCGKNFLTVISSTLLTFFFSLPIPAIILFFYPLCHANRLLHRRDCALVGEESVTEYSQSKTVIFRDKDMYTVRKCTQVMTREGEDFRRDMHLAAILFRKMHGALEELDPRAAQKAALDPPVAFVRLSENGTEAMIDKRYHLLAGDAKFMTNSGIRIPKERTENATQRTENTCLMYLAVNGMLKLIYEIEYDVEPLFEEIVARLAEHNTQVAIRTFDPNLNSAFLEQSRNVCSEYVRVIKPTAYESNSTMEVSDSGIVALGSRFDLSQPIMAAAVIQKLRRHGYTIQFIIAALGAALSMFLTFWQVQLQNSVALLIALLFQGVVCAAAWLVTRLVFRFGSSENLK